MKQFKTLSIFLTALLMAGLISACAKEKSSADEKKAELSSSVAASENLAAASGVGQLHYIKSVLGAPKKGKAPDFTWEINGKTYKFSEYTKNKVVLLNFWATWCPPCRMEIPDIIALDKEMPDKDFVVVGVSLDNRGTLQQVTQLVQNFIKAKKIPYINFLLTQDLITPYGGVANIPTTFIIDKNGNIVNRIVGARNKAFFKQAVMNAMK